MATALVPSLAAPRILQFRLATLLVAMVWVGLICIGMRTPTPLWSGVVAMLGLLVIVSTGLIAIYRTGRKRAAAIGFLVFAGSFMITVENYWGMPLFAISSLSSRIFGDFGELIHGSGRLVDEPYSFPTSLLTNSIAYHRSDFVTICDHAAAILFGVAGAVVAQILYATQRRDAELGDK